LYGTHTDACHAGELPQVKALIHMAIKQGKYSPARLAKKGCRKLIGSRHCTHNGCDCTLYGCIMQEILGAAFSPFIIA
jgi:hypothetical protein